MLDPAANARALGDIQRRGLRAAGELVDRLVGGADGERHARQPTSAGPTGTPGPAGAESDDGTPSGSYPASGASSPTSDLVQVWVDLFRRGLQAVTETTARGGALMPGGAQTATADLGTGSTTGTVHVEVDDVGWGDVGPRAPDDDDQSAQAAGDRGGRRGSAEIWLHNGTGAPIGGLRLHCGDLRAHDGATVPTDALRFDPPSLDELPARSSRGVVVETRVDGDVAPGTYRGVILVAGAPEVWLPIDVTVADGSVGRSE
jgi:hypothetical protein